MQMGINNIIRMDLDFSLQENIHIWGIQIAFCLEMVRKTIVADEHMT